MAGFSEILGQDHIREHFRRAAQQRNPANAYLIEGARGMGKHMLALAAAQVLQCERQDGTACGRCRSCIQAGSGNQPDIRFVTHEKPASIGVEDVRVQLVEDIRIRPYASPYKIYIIGEGEKMTVQAQNTILKTIEEPPSYGIVFLLTENRDIFLETIRSRCVIFPVRPLKRETVRRYLMEQKGIPDYQAEGVLTFAGGNLGRAVALASGDDFSGRKELVVRTAKKLCQMQEWELFGVSKNFLTNHNHNSSREENIENLDLLLLWYRDVYYYKSSCSEEYLYYREEAGEIERQAEKLSFHGCMQIMEDIEQAKARMQGNVNPELGMDRLLMDIYQLFHRA